MCVCVCVYVRERERERESCPVVSDSLGHHELQPARLSVHGVVQAIILE